MRLWMDGCRLWIGGFKAKAARGFDAAQNDLQNMQKRKSVYDEKPASVELHGFTSLRQAQQALAKVEKVQPRVLDVRWRQRFQRVRLP